MLLGSVEKQEITLQLEQASHSHTTFNNKSWDTEMQKIKVSVDAGAEKVYTNQVGAALFA